MSNPQFNKNVPVTGIRTFIQIQQGGEWVTLVEEETLQPEGMGIDIALGARPVVVGSNPDGSKEYGKATLDVSVHADFTSPVLPQTEEEADKLRRKAEGCGKCPACRLRKLHEKLQADLGGPEGLGGMFVFAGPSIYDLFGGPTPN